MNITSIPPYSPENPYLQGPTGIQDSFVSELLARAQSGQLGDAQQEWNELAQQWNPNTSDCGGASVNAAFGIDHTAADDTYNATGYSYHYTGYLSYHGETLDFAICGSISAQNKDALQAASEKIDQDISDAAAAADAGADTLAKISQDFDAMSKLSQNSLVSLTDHNVPVTQVSINEQPTSIDTMIASISITSKLEDINIQTASMNIDKINADNFQMLLQSFNVTASSA